MTAVALAPLTSPWPADAGYFHRGPLTTQPHIDYGTCASCRRSVYIAAGGAERHTDNNDFRCPDPFDGTGFAALLDVEDLETQLEQLEEKHANDLVAECEQAQEIGHDDGFEEGKQEGLDEGVEQGRKDMHAEIDQALNETVDAALRRMTPDQASACGPLLEALASAWNRCAP
jgi:hypothetical protein